MEALGVERLSERTRTVWAKSCNAQGEWLRLHTHLADSARVAAWLWDHWLPRHLKITLAEKAGVPEGPMRSLAVFLAGVHDVGKASPIFSCAAPDLLRVAGQAGLDPTTDPALRPSFRHETIGAHHLQGWLQRHDVGRREARSWASVVGAHHGRPSTQVRLQAVREDLSRLGGPIALGRNGWAETRDELIAWQWEAAGLGGEDVLPGALDEASVMVLAGLVVVADWIASNEEFFGYGSEAVRDPSRAEKGLARLALPAPWRPSGATSASELLADRFGIDGGARPVQSALVELARTMPGPGIIVCEAPMGEGKTEAALMAAEVLCERFGLGGVHVALPTQATTDAMFGRVLPWVERQPQGALEVGAAVHLGHGKARLNSAFRDLPRALRGVHDDATTGDGRGRAAVHPWLAGRKRQLLSTFVVSTIDQLLMAGLRQKHLMLRHLAAAGKVVIIDEVHAYDEWMQIYLERVLRWLAAYRVPVILLSATLPRSRRTALVAAYAGTTELRDAGDHYPLLTWSAHGESGCVAPSQSGRGVIVDVARVATDCMAHVAVAAARQGANVLLVKSTVNGAIDTYAEVRAQVQASLHHSRFLAIDRARQDAALLAMFGPTGDRPGGWVAVTTQVAEQSLDVDFDLLVTDLAPIDSLLQRLGRVHRHSGRQRPAGFEQPRMVIGESGHRESGSPSLDRPSAVVYGEWSLLRSEVVLEGLGAISLPGDIPRLVNHAYDGVDAPPSWRDALAAAKETAARQAAERRHRASQFALHAPDDPSALLSWAEAASAEGPGAQTRAEAHVRDIDPAVEVVVVVGDAEGRWRVPAWIRHPGAGASVPRDRPPRAEVADALQGCTLRIPQRLVGDLDAFIADRWAETPPAWELSDLAELPVLLLGPDLRLTLATGRGLHYDPELGLTTFKEDDT